ncbi:hypothetical protein [Phaeodactylibacter luteus]|uniref:DUF3108 domain-containing protein n=1 Tax=Phaeodactylibacter luteus TaxID=1564516 RepID=A0A5C6RIA2_9BACT|nr:hypothetical protein [Phaeodactylibacter luteus]TXB61689.1 hypothetical protein FRY97_17755 [Phaeodactylibacter luteus]
MNVTKSLALAVALLTGGTALNAQQFLVPFEGFSRKKSTYVTLSDGTEVEGTLKKWKQNRGLIAELQLELDGGKRTIMAEEISHMYVPASALGKFGAAMEGISNLEQAQSKSDLDAERLKDDYAYFEYATVDYERRGDRRLLLQLVNPGFESGVRVYHDPFAAETRSVGVGGVTITGGIEKSYYVKKGDAKAFLVKKKDYDEHFLTLFGDCKALVKEVGSKPNWKNFPKHVFKYSTMCE